MTIPGRGRASTARHRCWRRPRPDGVPAVLGHDPRRALFQPVAEPACRVRRGQIDGLAPGDRACELEPLVGSRRGQAVNQVPDAQPHDGRHRPAAGHVGDVAFGQRSLVRERRAEQREVEDRSSSPDGEARPNVPVPAGHPVRARRTRAPPAFSTATRLEVDSRGIASTIALAAAYGMFDRCAPVDGGACVVKAVGAAERQRSDADDTHSTDRRQAVGRAPPGVDMPAAPWSLTGSIVTPVFQHQKLN